jgi:1-acyl-sn-glycerol-3-phosphate acyltransferase
VGRGAAIPFEGPAGRLIYDAHYWAVFWSLTLGASYRASGREHFPRSGPALVLANHQSFLDPIFISLAVGRPLAFLARSTLFMGGIFDRMIRAYGAVPIDKDNARDGIRAVLDCLDQGRAVLVFPEGERTFTGRMNPFKPGVTLLIEKAKVPVVPVGLAGAFEFWPRTDFWPGVAPLMFPSNGKAVAAHVGKPIAPTRWAGRSRTGIMKELEDEIGLAHRAAEAIRRK